MNYAVKPPEQLKSFGGLLKWLNQLRAFAISLYIADGLTYNIAQDIDGQQIILDPTASTSGAIAAAQPFPFQISIQPVTGSTTEIDVLVYPGTINSILPSNLISDFQAASTNGNNITTISGTTYVALNVSTNGQNVTAATLSVEGAWAASNAPVATALVGCVSFSILLGIINNGVVYQSWFSNVAAALTEAFRQDKSTPQPGTMTYIPWYQWVCTAA